MNVLDWYGLRALLDPRRTAVIGNAATAVQRPIGAEIDAASLVVRFNQAQTRGYEAFLGRRTDLLICNAAQFEQDTPPTGEPGAGAVLILVDPASRARRPACLARWLGETPVAFSLVPDVLIASATPRTQRYTSGTYGLYTLLSCFEIDALLVTGFTFYDSATGPSAHYWPDKAAPVPPDHDLKADREAVRHLLRGFSGELTLDPTLQDLLDLQ